MMFKKVAIGIVLMLSLLCASWIVSPYWAAYRIHSALKHNDAALLSRYVDYPALRSDLKPQIEQRLLKKIGQPENTAWWGRMQQSMVHQVSEHLVDWLLTPNGILLILQGKAGYESKLWQSSQQYLQQMAQPVEQWIDKIAAWFEQDSISIQAKPNLAPITIDAQSKTAVAKFQMTYIDFDHFEMILPYQQYTLVVKLRRQQAWTWQIVAVRLPQD